MNRICVICGCSFKCSPSDKKVTCSDGCRSERARRSKTALGRHWSGASRVKLSLKGQTANLKKGTAAALLSPIAGPFETNKQALIWTLLSPEGITYEARNLNLWLKQHADILPGTPEQARAGLVQIKRSMQGKTKRPVNQWKGWRLICWEKPKED